MTESEWGRMLPRIRIDPPGPASRELARRLRRTESRNVTYLADDFPVFWDEARGANVRDADGNVYLDLTGAFGVALLGHGEPRIARAVAEQTARLVHGMGDVHPPAIKVELLERLTELLPWPDGRAILATGGAEAVEIALKTALLATGRPGILAFRGGYHGLTMGALAATARSDFREPFASRLYGGTSFVPFPSAGAPPASRRSTSVGDGPDGYGGSRGDPSTGSDASTASEVLERVEEVLTSGVPGGEPVGAVVVEPIQGRGGIRIPPPGFLADLAALARDHGALVIADEIFTGLGRAGSFLASTDAGVTPDLVCLGKALGGGFPLSVCAGPSSVMDAWPESEGEALHTSTFLGHPATCAAALAFLDLVESEDVPVRAERRGKRWLEALTSELEGAESVVDVRGRGLMLGIELGPGGGADVARRALIEGVLLLPAGDRGEVVELTPPLAVTDEQLEAGVAVVGRVVRRMEVEA